MYLTTKKLFNSKSELEIIPTEKRIPIKPKMIKQKENGFGASPRKDERYAYIN